MTITTTEQLLVDGVALNTLAWNVSTWTGRLGIPARKGDVLTPPGRSGALPLIHAPFQAGGIGLAMWVVGCTADGEVPTDSSMRAEFESNREQLVNLFTRGGLMHLQQYKPDGSIRETWATLNSAIDFTTQAGGTRAEFNVALEIPGTFWQDPTATTSLVVASSLPAQLAPAELVGCTAPIEDGIVQVHGPIIAPKIVEDVTSAYVQLGQDLGASDVWILDTGAYTSTINGTPSLNFTHKGSTQLLSIKPRLGASPKIRLEGTNPSSATTFQLTAHRKFLTP